MDDIAMALGVAKGTVYRYVESKDALFDLVLRCADLQEPFAPPPRLPIPTPQPGETLQYVRERLAREQHLPSLLAALTKQRVTHAQAELEGILRELYGRMARNRQGITLLDRSARDYPEVAALWFEGARGGVLAALTQYLQTRIQRKLLQPVPDSAVAARFIIESIVFWAVHRHRDPYPQALEDTVARETVVQFLLRALGKKSIPYCQQ